MTTVYSKLSLDTNSDSEVTSSGFENLDKSDIDLIDKIKLAIPKLKTINEESSEKEICQSSLFHM